MGNVREEIDRGIVGQGVERGAVAADGGDALLPGLGRRRLRVRGPVVRGPGQLLVAGVAAEVEDVVLRAPDVLDELPRRVREALRCDAPEGGGMPLTAASKPTCASSQSRILRRCARSDRSRFKAAASSGATPWAARRRGSRRGRACCRSRSARAPTTAAAGSPGRSSSSRRTRRSPARGCARGAVAVGRVHAGGQPVLGVVHQRERLRRRSPTSWMPISGPKVSSRISAMRWSASAKHRGREVEAGPVEAGAAAQHPAAVRHRVRDLGLEHREVRGPRDGPM